MSLRNKIFLFRGDITKMAVDAIVNAANRSLLGGGGVDGAIHQAAGRKLLEECKEIGGCETGDAVITHAYNIDKVRAIIHTVGPNVFSKVTEKDRMLLSNCYWNSLELAKKYKLTSIAFPCISTGVYSYPNDEAAKVALNTVKKWLETEKDYLIYKEYMPKIFSSNIDEHVADDKFEFERSHREEEMDKSESSSKDCEQNSLTEADCSDTKEATHDESMGEENRNEPSSIQESDQAVSSPVDVQPECDKQDIGTGGNNIKV